MSEPSSEEQDYRPVIIDPDGDLKLLAGEGQYKTSLLVSSKVLCLASDVFRVMLYSSGLAEAQAFLANSVLNIGPTEISLPDDEAVGMQALCELLHFRTPNPRNYVGVMVPAMIVAEKYNCITAIAPWIGINLPMDKCGSGGFESILPITFMIKNLDIFERAGREFL
ncbi:hypothetical protein K402DRAFT_344884, partial [Aulographum hederae CBS 113979]